MCYQFWYKYRSQFRFKFAVNNCFKQCKKYQSKKFCMFCKVIIYTVSKNIPDIFDCDLKTNYQILIIFGRNIPHATCHQNDHSVSHITQRLFLHCLGKTQPAKYHFYPMQYDCLIKITRKNILFTFLTLWLTFHPVIHFSTDCSKIA